MRTILRVDASLNSRLRWPWHLILLAAGTAVLRPIHAFGGTLFPGLRSGATARALRESLCATNNVRLTTRAYHTQNVTKRHTNDAIVQNFGQRDGVKYILCSKMCSNKVYENWGPSLFA